MCDVEQVLVAAGASVHLQQPVRADRVLAAPGARAGHLARAEPRAAGEGGALGAQRVGGAGAQPPALLLTRALAPVLLLLPAPAPRRGRAGGGGGVGGGVAGPGRGGHRDRAGGQPGVEQRPLLLQPLHGRGDVLVCNTTPVTIVTSQYPIITSCRRDISINPLHQPEHFITSPNIPRF